MITIQADEREVRALMVLIDAAVRASGIRGAGDAINWVIKLEAALRMAKESSANSKGLIEDERPILKAAG